MFFALEFILYDDIEATMCVQYHQAMSRVVAECIRNLADSHVLPFNFTEYAHALQLNLQLLEQGYGQDIRNNVSPASMGEILRYYTHVFSLIHTFDC